MRNIAHIPRVLAFVRILLLVGLSFVLATGGCSAGKRAPEPVQDGADYVLAPEEAHYGASYAEWSARWWQWVFELPRTNHPLRDPTGADAARGQVDPVWFLGGTWNESGIVERTVEVPRGVALFFPIVNAIGTNATCEGPPDYGTSLSERRDEIASAVQNARDIVCVIDGVRVIDARTIEDAVRWRAQAAEFSTLIPEDNLWADSCGGIPPAGPTVIDWNTSDGVWMMIGPMPEGFHDVQFQGRFPTWDPPYEVNVTYHIHVLP